MVVIYSRRILKSQQLRRSNPYAILLTSTGEQRSAINYIEAPAPTTKRKQDCGKRVSLSLLLKMYSPENVTVVRDLLISAKIQPTLHISIAFVYSLNAIPPTPSHT